MHRVLVPALLLAVVIPLIADDARKAVTIFNGKDLAGWVNVNCAPNTFTVQDGEIVTDGKPTGFLRTDKHYENFVLEMEWKHSNVKAVGNSGLFVWGDPLPAVGTGYTRGIEVQVLVNFEVDWATSHGDLFSIWGAKCKPDRPHPKGYERCLPSERRCKGGGEWNHYKVTGNDGAIKLEVNGKEVSGLSQCSPRKGYLALESEGAECRFRNLKLTELPSTNPKPEEVADLDRGFVSLYNGVNLDGWEANDSWKAGEVLTCTGDKPLSTTAKPGAIDLLFDVLLPKETTEATLTVRGQDIPVTAKPGVWKRLHLVTDAGKGTPIVLPALKGLQVRNVFLKKAK